MTSPETATSSQITIRRMDLSADDQARLTRLAALDSHAPLDGPVLGAEVEGELRAAISVATGELVADPFVRTSELSALLGLRADQMRAQRRGARRPRRRGLRRPRLALGGSPPGEIETLLRTS
jgi:hypothetical protein